MRWTSVVCLCVLAVHFASSFPLEDSQSNKLETISTLEESLGKPTSEHSDREKRTIGFLRTLFPGLSKIIDDKIQQLTSVIFRVVGRFVLRGGGLGGGGGGGNSDSSGGGDGSRRISITLPTYPPDEDEDDDETEAPDTSSVEPSTESNDVVQQKEKEGESSRRRREAPADLEPAESEKKEERVPIVPDNKDNKISDKDDDGDDVDEAESENEEVSDAGESAGESTTRNKRLGVLSSLFGGGRDSGSGSGSGSGGGSGNFLFDIIRKSADGAARAAGTVYRMIAGTETTAAPDTEESSSESPEFERLELDTAAATAPTVRTPPADPKTPLVAGSGATEQQDENANSPIAPGNEGPASIPSDDGYQAGIPGPITRLFVIANRGFANLIQDLILRLAQTSERIVNFKARLITAII